MIRKAELADCPKIAALAQILWPEHTFEEMEQLFSMLLHDEKAAVFLAEEDGTAVGFAQCQLRQDYVEGALFSPVAYLEGIFVKDEFRGQGISGRLVRSCEDWGKARGCREIASDCDLDNVFGSFFHLKNGFKEVNRIICFIKRL